MDFDTGRDREDDCASSAIPETRDANHFSPLPELPFGSTSAKEVAAHIRGVADAISRSLPPGAGPGRSLVRLLQAVSEESGAADLRTAAAECGVLARRHPDLAERLSRAAAHLRYLAADRGCRDSACVVAACAVARAAVPDTPESEALDLMAAALGWLSAAGGANPPSIIAAQAGGKLLLRRLTAEWRRQLTRQEPAAEPDDAGTRFAEDEWKVPDEPPSVDARQADGSAVVVVSSIGSPSTAEGRRVFAAYGEMAGKALPLLPVPDLDAVVRELAAAFPHAAGVIGAILADLRGRSHIRLRPAILVGPPGCGKTTFALHLLRLLGVPSTLYPCGGTADAALAGNPRRWLTGEPCLPVSLAAEHGTASPGILLDELEKAGTGTQNGRLHDALLGMFEPSSASRWQDPYLQSAVDISRVVWIATANSLEGVPVPLRDRCRILAFPAPAAAHLGALAPGMLRNAVAERGLDTGWAMPLDGVELRALEAAWRGGSMRALRRLVDCVLAARDRAPGLN